jgi:hypothetical protein
MPQNLAESSMSSSDMFAELKTADAGAISVPQLRELVKRAQASFRPPVSCKRARASEGSNGTAEGGSQDEGSRSRGDEALAVAGLSLGELKVVLRSEEAARLSDTTQAAYGEAERDAGAEDWLQVAEALQRTVLERHGVPPRRMSAALWLMRCASQLWPDDPDLSGPHAISLYVRHNRAEQGTLREGDVAPDVPLFGLSQHPSSVLRACPFAHRTLLVTGSFS